MLNKETILSLSLIREVKQPVCEQDKFVNSDKNWNEVDLGKNMKASEAAFMGVRIAFNKVTSTDQNIDI